MNKVQQLENEMSHRQALIDGLGEPHKYVFTGEVTDYEKPIGQCACGHPIRWAFHVRHNETGVEKVDCAVIKSPWKVVFNRTEHGLFQPSPAITKYIRVPYKKLTIFLNDFIKDSEGLIKKEVKFLS